MKIIGLTAVKNWLTAFEVKQPQIAHLICSVIPPHCPFERTIRCFHWTVRIPPLCHLNPVYEELMVLRFRALEYLVEVCGEDITKYCH
ncbi:Mo-dependent nitrogenase C-terminal domain-containing protein [Lyngbya confervoides]|uniref:Mo-dependent nitrogenase C-terminal domain-containing protein n=1 Tax=Lyngbya confervoides BDU141951 TaxID=1574623 RepID=A0ABD4SZC1_9CYAN|nr:Mo-dependent nitrogenase C-terminal domain-containing protein [Lyngbya confervoides]MCM1981495.1 Mo-dependent nitrogenase C-terminal domain-containing protein [Lyngbya confervoides BDU141951]